MIKSYFHKIKSYLVLLKTLNLIMKLTLFFNIFVLG